MSDLSPAPSKRMRLGTKSCAECRRRKVRCIYAPDSRACQECVAHGSECTVQKPKEKEPQPSSHQQSLQRRIDDLEKVIRRLGQAVTPSTDLSSSPSWWDAQTTKAMVDRLQSDADPLNVSSATPVNLSAGTTQVNSSSSTSPFGAAEMPTSAAGEVLEEDAPLLQLLKHAMMVQWDSLSVGRGQAKMSEDLRVRNCISALSCIIPRQGTLALILQQTQHLWSIWPWLPSTVWDKSSEEQIGAVGMAKDFISQAMAAETQTPAVAARAALWLGLCLQQLPREFGRLHTDLPLSPTTLMASYMGGAENLLRMDADRGGSIEGLEAMALLSKLYLNNGKPRKAWAIVRSAIDQAMLLGLHRMNENTDPRHKTVWSYLWQMDRQFSMILGFPCSLPESHPSLRLSAAHANGSSTTASPPHIAHQLSILAGRIVERNQNHANLDYYETLKIAHDLDECRRTMPTQWFEAPYPGTPMAAVYSIQTLKIMYFQLQKYLHLPYMLQAPHESKFVDSRSAALEACRGMVEAYQVLRDHKDPLTIICDVMDFQVFSAAMVIIIHLLALSQPPTPNTTTTDLHDQARDWERVSHTASTLKKVSEVMDCPVAQQAHEVLHYLLQARDGTYSGPQTYEAVIPYFGKVRISRPRAPEVSLSPPSSSSLMGVLDDQRQLMTTVDDAVISSNLPSRSVPTPPPHYNPNINPMPTEIQFCTDPFPSFTAGAPAADVFPDPELHIDWTAMFDNIVPENYDYNQVFYVPGSYSMQ
ncbi:Fungal specific transcription factor [Apiospora saccharicola]|uniref:Fungal specific transcription factor n=1 Tax=Apiospora saccharicola TaxID=335842 RepID=A0ABR1UHL3_9PEZI